MANNIFTYKTSPVCASFQVRALEAINDIRDSVKSHTLWVHLGLRTLRGQYQRTYLGPLWISAQSALLVVVLSVLRVAINDELQFGATLAYVGLGLPIVTFWATASTRSITTFRSTSALVHKNNLTSFVAFQRWFFEILEGLHELVPIMLIVAAIHNPWNLQIILLGYTISLLILSTLSFKFSLGVLGCRFRDLEPIVSTFNRLQLFLCPIFWSFSDLPRDSILRQLAQVVPATYFVVNFRDSLIGTRDSGELFIHPSLFLIIFTLSGCSLGLLLFVKYRKMIPYWQLAE